MAIILIALRLTFEELMYRLFGWPKRLTTPDDDAFGGNVPRKEHVPYEPIPDHIHDRSIQTSPDHNTSDPGDHDGPNVHITNIEIHDSIINRSSIGSDDDDDEGDSEVHLKDAILHRAKLPPDSIEE